jgi:hypothetical protein
LKNYDKHSGISNLDERKTHPTRLGTSERGVAVSKPLAASPLDKNKSSKKSFKTYEGSSKSSKYAPRYDSIPLGAVGRSSGTKADATNTDNIPT